MPHPEFKEDDTLPVLNDSTDPLQPLDTAENLSGGSAALYVEQQRGGGTMIVNAGSATVDDDTPGAAKVSYQFNQTQTANLGTHDYEWVVTYSDGDQETFPKDGFEQVVFAPQLNRGGTQVTPDTSGRAGPIDILLLNEQASAPSSPQADDWGVYADDKDVLRRVDQNGTVLPVASWNRTDVTATAHTLAPWDSAWVNTSAAGANVIETLPADADILDGDRVEVGVEHDANDVNITANSGQSIIGQTANLTANGSTRTYEYKSDTSAWMVR